MKTNVDDDRDWKFLEKLPNAGPYAFKGDQWVCYDDVKIVEKKAEYVVENSLGGLGAEKYISSNILNSFRLFSFSIHLRNHVLGN